MRSWLLLLVFAFSLVFIPLGCSQTTREHQRPALPPIFARDLHPMSQNVPLDSTIAVTFSRWVQFIELTAEPYIDIAHIDKKELDDSIRFIFYPAKRLERNTTYDVIVRYMDSEGERALGWKFTTEE